MSERRRAAVSPPCSPDTDANAGLLPGRESINDVPLDSLLANSTPPKRSGAQRKPRKMAALKLLSHARRHNIAKFFFQLCSAWILFALLWIWWPLCHRKLAPSLETRLGDKQEVEPVVVCFALVLPFLLAGTVFYWKQENITSLGEQVQQSKLVRWLKTHPSIGKHVGFDAVDVIVVSVFLLLQLNLVICKLLIDRESGKLAKAGYISRTARAFGMNGLYAMVLSVILVARQSFLHKAFGLSGERAARYHVLMGQFGFFMLLLHGAHYSVTWYTEGKLEEKIFPCLDNDCSPKQRYGSIRNFFGVVAMGALFVIAVSSMEWVRRRFFRRFVVLHCLSVIVVFSTALHYYAASFWMVPAIVLYVIYRIVSAFGRGKANVVSATAMSNKVFQLELRRSTTDGSDFLPGQYVYISIGKEWHPFSISSSPLRNRHSFVLDTKVQGTFTKQLLTLMRSQQLDSVYVDGYYGSEIKLAPHMVFVAGGSGMTPFLSILDHLKALADASGRDKVLTDDSELPRSLWVIWTCRDLEFLEAYAELLDAVNRCSRWKCKVWLHLTQAGSDEDKCDNEDDDTQTESDDLSDVSTPRLLRFHPISLSRHAFSGHSYMLGTPLFVGTALGCGLLILWVLQVEGLSAKSFARRSMLLGAGVLGSMLGAALVAYLLRRKNIGNSDGDMGVAMGELEVTCLDISVPVPPSTPRTMPTPAQSLLNRSFVVEKKRPDLGLWLRSVHSEIRENYGMQAKAALLVSGPAGLQSDILLHARELLEPAFEVHQKSFLL